MQKSVEINSRNLIIIKNL